MGITIPGVGAAYATAIQGIGSGIPVPVSGNFNPFNALVKVPLTTSTSSYLGGYCVGGLQTLANALRSPALTGRLNSIQLGIKSTQSATFSAYIFDALPANSSFADRSVPSISTLDVSRVIAGPIVLSSPASGLGSSGTFLLAGNLNVGLMAASTTLYAILIISALLTTFGSASDLQVTYGISQD
jgi:hypothetical protein